MKLAFPRRGYRLVLSSVFALMALPSCGSSSSTDGMGATPGGSQYDALAGEKIASGAVPKPEDITVEGKLASHDLPLESPVCEKPLCISSAYAVAPTLDADQSAVFVQIGFSSGIDEETFSRAPLNLSVVVDRSGSMAGKKIEAVRIALRHLLDQLSERDRLSIVLFDDQVDVLLPSTPLTDKAEVAGLISDISERGSTNLSAGLGEGFAQIEAFSGEPGYQSRVFVLTDAQANTGTTDTNAFVEQASGAAEQGVGLTVFGVGADLNQDLVLAISKLRGGSYYYLADYATISRVFDQDFDFLVTPLAYDLQFRLTPSSGFRVRSVYGFPSWTTQSATVDIDVATVFLSRGHGAVVARLEPDGEWPTGEAPLAGLSLTYQPADTENTGSTQETEAFETVYGGRDPLDDESLFYSQPDIRRTVAYLSSALGQRQACARYWDGDASEAVSLLNRTEALLLEEAATLDDAELEEEAALVAQLRSNMQGGYSVENQEDYEAQGYPACSLYGPNRSTSDAFGTLLSAAVLGAVLRGVQRRRR